MSKHTITIDTNYTPLLSTLDPYKYNVIDTDKKPTITELPEGDVAVNTDIYIDSRGDLTDDDILLLGDRRIKQYRLNKTAQMRLLNNKGVKTPRYITRRNAPLGIHSTVADAVRLNVDTILIKAEQGARGIGQLIMDVNDMPEVLTRLTLAGTRMNDKEFLELIKSLDPKVRVPGNYRDDDELVRYVRDLVEGENSFSVQEYFENIIKEYRVLWFSTGEIFVYDRDTNDGIPKTPNDLPEEVHGVITNACESMRDVGYLTASVDIYELADGDVGVFEFSNEYAYKAYSNTASVIREINESVALYVTEDLKG